jgi:hypothetical protein
VRQTWLDSTTRTAGGVGYPFSQVIADIIGSVPQGERHAPRFARIDRF